MNSDLKTELEKAGLTVLSSKEMPLAERPFAAVAVEVKMSPAVKESGILDLALKRHTKRGTELNISNFSFDSNRETIGFVISAKIPPISSAYYMRAIGAGVTPKIATTFPDFCWLLSEGTTRENVIQSRTTPVDYIDNAKVELGDLTWALPSRFADDLIEAMHVLNNALFEGLLEDAILYGPL